LDQSLTTGIVSGLGREIQSEDRETIKDVIQVNAAINPGNSGGPLLDSAGRLIGVTTAIVSPTGAFSGIGFAIPVDTVNSIVPQLIRSGTMEPAALGLTLFRDEQTARLRERKFIKDEGVLVADVWSGGAAEAAGIQPTQQTAEGIAWGDLIIAIDGKPVHDVKTLAQIVASKKVGDVVKVTIERDGKRLELSVTLLPRPAEPEQ
jgi:S1-C subfamily serine protease